nr:MAG TPA: hypothetical protein [Caudoviricetes sp.]
MPRYSFHGRGFREGLVIILHVNPHQPNGITGHFHGVCNRFALCAYFKIRDINDISF